ncbi:nuclear transport factor 2 family protein [candidate division CSSED10-310 bacterium]|uniref:Nuclear transport factor 2 family protein n=1 Tax=candidate division CSSED10-310 bacterium TaxID=2855610 RepID=A0ABV6YXF0_UNCC1
MKIVLQIFKIVLIALLLYSVIIILRHPHKAYYKTNDAYIYSNGNASDSDRSEIMKQLHAFQDGYSKRDTAQLKPFMEQLFSQENILVLGTMPQEILIGVEKVSKLVLSDWKSWGDCTFLMDNAHISTAGNVAWISTIGYVKFDMSRFLILPLRLSAVMVRENPVWKFQYMQFQFDLDFTFLLFTLVVLMIWLPVSLLVLTVMIVKRVRLSIKSEAQLPCVGDSQE